MRSALMQTILGSFFLILCQSAQSADQLQEGYDSCHLSNPDCPAIDPNALMKSSEILRIELLFADLSDSSIDAPLNTEWRLEPYSILSPDIEFIVVNEAGDDVRQLPPSIAAFKGYRGDEENPTMSLTLGPDGSARGLLFEGSRTFALWGSLGEDRDNDATRTVQLKVTRAIATSGVEDPSQPFCSAKQAPEVTADFIDPPEWYQPVDVVAGSGELFLGSLNIETDHALYQKFNNTGQLVRYIADLALGTSLIYQNDINMRLNVRYIRVWPQPNDPWNQPNNRCQLHQLAAHYEQLDHVYRTTVQMLSGAGDAGSGVAWVHTYCRNPVNAASPGGCTGGFIGGGQIAGPYGLSRVNGFFDPSGSQMVTDLAVFAHELGHTIGAAHTHCWSGGYVDHCWNEQPGCYSGPTSLPGPPGQGSGTIMSYCHQRFGGNSNIGFSLGRNHPYGNAPDRVPDLMQSLMQFVLDNAPWCAAPSELLDRRLIGVDKSGQGRVFTQYFTDPVFDLDCGNRCAFAFRSDWPVSLTTETGDGWISTGFDGCDSSDHHCQQPEFSHCHINSGDDARAVFAYFEPAAALSVEVISDDEANNVASLPESDPNCQRVICSGNFTDLCSTKMSQGQTLTLRASFGQWPDNPYHRFVGWQGDCQGRDEHCVLEMDQDRLVTAVFGERSEVRLMTLGEGALLTGDQTLVCPIGSERPWQCDHFAERDSKVTFQAVTLPDRYFVGWRNGSLEVVCPDSDQCSVIASPLSQSLQAYFSSGPAVPMTPDVSLVVPEVIGFGPDFVYSIEVPTGTASVSVELEETCNSSFCGLAELMIRYGHPASLSSADCQVETAGQGHGSIASCTISNPTAGRYYVSIRGSFHPVPFATGSLLTVSLDLSQIKIFSDDFKAQPVSCLGHCNGPHPDVDCWCDMHCHDKDDCCVSVCEDCNELPNCQDAHISSIDWLPPWLNHVSPVIPALEALPAALTAL